MYGEKSLSFIKKNAEHYKALGIDNVYTHDNIIGVATVFVAGGMHRHGICVSGYFMTRVDGISVQQNFGLEGFGANGKAGLHIDTVAVRSVARQITHDNVRRQFYKFLEDALKKAREIVDETEQYLSTQRRIAGDLELLVSDRVSEAEA